MAGVTRRRLLAMGGGLAAMAVAGCGSNTGRADAGSGGSSGDKPALAQWYHQYGEAGTQQAVERYAKAYPDATVTVQWSPGDYDKKMSTALLTDQGPDVFESGNGPTIDMIKANQVVELTDLLGDAKSDFTPIADRPDDVPGQAVRGPAGHRHAAARLPQEPAQRGRRPAAARPSTICSRPLTS